MSNERSQRGTHLNVRVSRKLEDDLEMHRELRHHKSLSQTIKFFLRLGITSIELLDELKENPSLKDSIVEEWRSSLKFMTSEDTLEDEFNGMSDYDLETVVMMGYIELSNRKRKIARKEFHFQENQINAHVESIFDNRIGDDAKSK
jgi:hypothetical protein